MKYKLIFAAALAVSCSGAFADPPSWAPAHGYRDHHERQERQRHEYIYYRGYSQPIYYAPQRGTWFWFSDGRWQAGVSLPGYLAQFTSGGVQIQLNSAEPYQQNAYVYEHYGRPYADRHAREVYRDHRHHDRGDDHDRGDEHDRDHGDD